MKAGIDLTEGPILKKILQFAIPVLLTSLMQQLYHAADSMIVGNFASGQALAAVGSTGALTGLIVNLFMDISIGSNVYCARCFGAKDTEGLSRAVHTSLFLGLLLGMPVAVIGWFFSDDLLVMMGTPKEIVDQAALYMRIIFIGSPLSMVFNYGAAVIRAVGDTKKPLYILTVSGITNVVLNIVFVAVFRWDVAGVAISTVISQFVSVSLVVGILMKTNSEIKLSLKKFRLYGNELKQILIIGIPTGMSNIFFSASNVALQSAANLFGTAAVAAKSIGATYANLAHAIISAGEQACTCFVGQNIGAKRYDRIGKIVRTSMMVSGVAVFVFATVINVFGKFFIEIFNKDPEIVKNGLLYLRYVVMAYVLFTPSLVFGGALRGMGRATYQMILSLVFMCGLRVAWIIFVLPHFYRFETMLLTYSVSWIAAGIAGFIVFAYARRQLSKND